MTKSLHVFSMLLLVACACLVHARDVRACGLFAPRVNVKAPPRLEHERTLILWDGVGHREHFVREVRFGGSGEHPFGFVVPTPSRPEVNAVNASPFDTLEARYGHTLLDVPESRAGGGFEGKGAPGSGAARGIGGAPPVQVLEKKRIGDFTSFVLAASDPKALADWLKKNQFSISEAGKAWTARYVELGFFFVALRYDGKKKKAGEGEGLLSRSMRISFDTPLPYYPYAEPTDAPEQPGRELQVWLVSAAPLSPLAGVATSAGWEIRRPWSEGARYEASRDELSGVLGSDLAALLPARSSLQTFGDWKEHRRGFGDLVLAPSVPEACDSSCAEARRPLLALLDPSLRAATRVDASELAVPAPGVRSGTSRPGGAAAPTPAKVPPPIADGLGSSCGVTHGRFRSSHWLALALVLGAGAARRARRRFVSLGLALATVCALALGACGGAPPPEAPPLPPPPAVASAPAPPLTIAVPGEEPPPARVEPYSLPSEPAARQKSLMRLLAGYHGERIISTWSTPLERGIGRARSSLSIGFADPSALERRCLRDDRIEAVVSFTLASGPDGRVERARVEGPLPDSMLGCLESELVSGLRGAPVARGWLSLGTISPDVLELRRRINAGKLAGAHGAARLKEGKLTLAQGLPKEVVSRIMRQQFGRFRLCYERATQPQPTGTVTLRFGIGPDGNVRDMAAATADVATETGICMGDVARQVAFPSPTTGRVVKVTYVVDFDVK